VKRQSKAWGSEGVEWVVVEDDEGEISASSLHFPSNFTDFYVQV